METISKRANRTAPRMQCASSPPSSGAWHLHEAQQEFRDALPDACVFTRQRVKAERSPESLERKQGQQEDEKDIAPRPLAVDTIKAEPQIGDEQGAAEGAEPRQNPEHQRHRDGDLDRKDAYADRREMR